MISIIDALGEIFKDCNGNRSNVDEEIVSGGNEEKGTFIINWNEFSEQA